MSTVEAPALSGVWRAEVTHSSIEFSIRHMVVSRFRGSLAEFDATLTFAPDGSVSLRGSAPVSSIATRDEVLTEHLLSPEFFDAARHPRLTLVSTSFALEPGEVSVGADITIRGVTQPALLRGVLLGPVEDPFGGERVGLDLATTIDRRDFGLTWNVSMPGGGFVLGHEVKLSALIAFAREPASETVA